MDIASAIPTVMLQEIISPLQLYLTIMYANSILAIEAATYPAESKTPLALEVLPVFPSEGINMLQIVAEAMQTAILAASKSTMQIIGVLVNAKTINKTVEVVYAAKLSFVLSPFKSVRIERQDIGEIAQIK